jgi:hydrogenase maturation protease
LLDALREDSTAGAKDAPGSAPVLEFRYQLNVEDAYALKDVDVAVFADAAAEGPDESALVEIGPSADIAFTTHEMSPASVLALCHELYGRAPRAYLLSIRGEDWEIGEGLSARGRANLARAAEVLRAFLTNG